MPHAMRHLHSAPSLTRSMLCFPLPLPARWSRLDNFDSFTYRPSAAETVKIRGFIEQFLAESPDLAAGDIAKYRSRFRSIEIPKPPERGLV